MVGAPAGARASVVTAADGHGRTPVAHWSAQETQRPRTWEPSSLLCKDLRAGGEEAGPWGAVVSRVGGAQEEREAEARGRTQGLWEPPGPCPHGTAK